MNYEPKWHPVWDTLRAGLCILIVAAMVADLAQNGGWGWAILATVVVVGGMAS